jgi:hypothetical protein
MSRFIMSLLVSAGIVAALLTIGLKESRQGTGQMEKARAVVAQTKTRVQEEAKATGAVPAEVSTESLEESEALQRDTQRIMREGVLTPQRARELRERQQRLDEARRVLEDQ